MNMDAVFKMSRNLLCCLVDVSVADQIRISRVVKRVLKGSQVGLHLLGQFQSEWISENLRIRNLKVLSTREDCKDGVKEP